MNPSDSQRSDNEPPTAPRPEPPMAERSDTELFRAITTQRSEAALEQLFRRYFSRLCEFAFRLSASHAAAEELVSDLFYKLYADGAALGVPENVAAYLFAATRRRVLNHRRDSGRRARAENLAGESEDAASADGLRLILFREMETEIDRLLQQLPPRRQMIFRLHRIEGFSYQEIADVLAISPHTVKAQMTEALRDLDRLRHS
jgi:RNA polymerase sigma-70 factor (ECF subfamily)